MQRVEIQKVSRTICEKTMHPNSLARHHKDIHHKLMVLSCVCVDEKQGLFFVRKHMKGGIVYCTHVKKLICENGIYFKCENDSSADFMEVTRLSNMPSVECCHLTQCSSTFIIPEKKSFLWRISASNLETD